MPESMAIVSKNVCQPSQGAASDLVRRCTLLQYMLYAQLAMSAVNSNHCSNIIYYPCELNL